MTSKYIVYLLHFSAPVGRALHYTGITRVERLEQRMMEHGHGRGAALTKAAIRQGATMYLTATVAVNHPSDEKLIKRRGHAKNRCPVCRNGLSAAETEARCYKLPQLKRGAFTGLGW